jgi:16S rRNA (guanine1207-N2)-methyltransferase
MPALAYANLYGLPPETLVDCDPAARQFSPLIPGSACLGDIAPGSLDTLAILAPPGTIERRTVLALALRALRRGAPVAILAPKDKGGSRLARELRDFGCPFEETAKKHYRICIASAEADEKAIDAAIDEGAPRFLAPLGLWTEPGVFSWNRIDPGSALLLRHLPPLAGTGADFGCGLGVLAHGVLASPRVTRLILIDLDRRAVALAQRNCDDARCETIWADLRWADLRHKLALPPLDFIVMNPPFHDGGTEDRELGRALIQRAAETLRPGGACWIVANRHLPYESVLAERFRQVALRAEEEGYKVFEARK